MGPNMECFKLNWREGKVWSPCPNFQELVSGLCELLTAQTTWVLWKHDVLNII